MCGIAGYFSKFAADKDYTTVQAMVHAQRHRGPDHSETKRVDGHLIFGHNRLSIIDRGPQAHQPFSDSSGRYTMVFNGEIYNYVELRQELEPSVEFRTQSDTEVLLAAYIEWGVQCLDKLNGMFAFAIYDKKERQLFAGRDRFGVKPFYYAKGKERFVFASEMKAFWESGVLEKKTNDAVWASYMVHGAYKLGDETFWEDIFELPAGHYAVVKEDGSIEINRWYHFEQNVKTLMNDPAFKARSDGEHLAAYVSLLKDSVKLRFRSDVPVGFNVSGGVDSSTLLGVVHETYPNDLIQAFTFYCNDDRYDELPWVEELIQETNKPLNKVLLTVDEVPDLTSKLSYYQDEPFGGIPTLAYSKIFEKANYNSVTVLLDGQGMDEAWAGYDYYHTDSDSVVQGVKSSPFRPNVLDQEFNALAEKQNAPNLFNDNVLNMQYRDLFYTKIPRALRFNDRLSMMHSRELREPFLDYRLVEYAFSLPYRLKYKSGSVKWMLRTLSQKYLKSDLTLAPKRPLQTPQREWLTDDLRHWVEGELLTLKGHPWIKWNELDKEWKKLLNGKVDNTFFLWQWISLTKNGNL